MGRSQPLSRRGTVNPPDDVDGQLASASTHPPSRTAATLQPVAQARIEVQKAVAAPAATAIVFDEPSKLESHGSAASKTEEHVAPPRSLTQEMFSFVDWKQCSSSTNSTPRPNSDQQDASPPAYIRTDIPDVTAAVPLISVVHTSPTAIEVEDERTESPEMPEEIERPLTNTHPPFKETSVSEIQQDIHFLEAMDTDTDVEPPTPGSATFTTSTLPSSAATPLNPPVQGAKIRTDRHRMNEHKSRTKAKATMDQFKLEIKKRLPEGTKMRGAADHITGCMTILYDYDRLKKEAEKQPPADIQVVHAANLKLVQEKDQLRAQLQHTMQLCQHLAWRINQLQTGQSLHSNATPFVQPVAMPQANAAIPAFPPANPYHFSPNP